MAHATQNVWWSLAKARRIACLSIIKHWYKIIWNTNENNQKSTLTKFYPPWAPKHNIYYLRSWIKSQAKNINKFSFKVQKLALTDQNKTKYTITIINQRTHNGFISKYVVRQRDVDQRHTYNLYWYFDTKIPQENSSIHIRVAKIRIRTHFA